MKKLAYSVFIILASFNLNGQSTEKTNEKNVCLTFDPAMWETPSRDPLRKELVALTGPLKGKTVLDIGAGSGYFTFEFAKLSKKVIATELDQRFLDYINQKKLSLNQPNVEARLADKNQSEFNGVKGVDLTVMVLVYHFLDDPKDFLTKLKTVMNKGGQVAIVNYEHFSVRFITDYLESTGFKDISIRKFTLEGSCGPEKMNIVLARNP